MPVHFDPVSISLCSLSVAGLSLLLSATVAWLTLLQRGNLKMTRPPLIALRYERNLPKIWLRTMLYSTGKKGHIVESLYLKVRRGELVYPCQTKMQKQSKKMQTPRRSLNGDQSHRPTTFDSIDFLGQREWNNSCLSLEICWV